MIRSVSAPPPPAELASRPPIFSPAALGGAPSATGNRMSQAARRSSPLSRRPAAIACPARPKPMKETRGVLRPVMFGILNRFHGCAAASRRDNGTRRRCAAHTAWCETYRDHFVAPRASGLPRRRTAGQGGSRLVERAFVAVDPVERGVEQSCLVLAFRQHRHQHAIAVKRAAHRNHESGTPGTGGVPCVWNDLIVCKPQAWPFLRSVSVQVIGFQSGASTSRAPAQATSTRLPPGS